MLFAIVILLGKKHFACWFHWVFLKIIHIKVKPFQKYKVIEIVEIIKTNRNEKISICVDCVNDF